MELSDEIRISASRAEIYEALNDPKILKICIPGCEELTKRGDTNLEAKVVLKIGPDKANFKGHVRLDPSNAPDRSSLSGEGKCGVAGFAKGGADVEFVVFVNDTILKYTVIAKPGGKIAQLGNLLMLATEKKLSASFFKNFKEHLVESKDKDAG